MTVRPGDQHELVPWVLALGAADHLADPVDPLGGHPIGTCATNRRVISIAKLGPEDRGAWEDLFRGYNEFYERTLTPQMADRAWTAFQADLGG